MIQTKPKIQIEIAYAKNRYSIETGDVSYMPLGAASAVLYSLFYDLPYATMFDLMRLVDEVMIRVGDREYVITRDMLYVPESMPRINHGLSALVITPLHYVVVREGAWGEMKPICDIYRHMHPRERYMHIINTHIDSVDVVFLLDVKADVKVPDGKTIIVGV